MTYKVPPVETKADIDKQIEIEIANLTWLEYRSKDDAAREAVQYVENKYKAVVQKLKAEGKY